MAPSGTTSARSSGVPGRVFLGLDLGWSTGATGIAVVDDWGRLLTSGRVRTDEEIADRVGRLEGRLVVAAVDAPVVVPNQEGHRLAERLLGRAYGAFGASAHVASRRRLGGEPRAMRLARRFGWDVDPDRRTGEGPPVCIEVYPHAAMVGLFGLGYRIGYKKGGVAQRRAGFSELVRLLEAVPELALGDNARWRQLASTAAAPRPGDLDRIEDEVDAVVCAHVAWLWHHRREALQVYGSAAEGFIVAPPPPGQPAVQPPRRPGPPVPPGPVTSI